jgi:hypothetical protein
MSGNIVTGYDGTRWYNRVVGSYIVANYRDTEAEARLKGLAMAQQRHVDHIVLDAEGAVVSHTTY